MATGHVLLGLLSDRDQHGYDLKHQHDRIFPEARPLAFGQVYATLERLSKKGHVRTVSSEVVDGPERTVYGITPAGRVELQEWLDAVEEPAPFVANPLAVKATVALLARDADDARRYLQAQRAAHLDRMRHYTRQKTDPAAELATVLAADYALAHLAADLEWLELAAQRVEALLPFAHELAPTNGGSDV